MQTVNVAELPVVCKFHPWKQVRACRGRVVTFETIRPVSTYLPADEAVRVLFRIEIVQRILEREEPVSVAGEHHHERCIPHEDVAVVSDIQIW